MKPRTSFVVVVKSLTLERAIASTMTLHGLEAISIAGYECCYKLMAAGLHPLL